MPHVFLYMFLYASHYKKKKPQLCLKINAISNVIFSIANEIAKQCQQWVESLAFLIFHLQY